MKKFACILLILFTTNLFAQNKHSELYYRVESIYKSNKKILVDSISSNRLKLKNEIESEYRNLLLVIDGIPYHFEILDSMDLNSIFSITFLPPSNFSERNLIPCRPTDGLIIIQTKEEHEKQMNSKKKKRKSKNN